MNDHGKSDMPVLPAKRPNNAGVVPVAEAVEGRGMTKGNTDSKTRPGHRAGSGASKCAGPCAAGGSTRHGGTVHRAVAPCGR